MKKLFYCALSTLSINLAYAEVNADELSNAIKNSDIVEVINLLSSRNYDINKKAEYSALADKIITDYENGDSTLKDVARIFIPAAFLSIALPVVGAVFFRAGADKTLNSHLAPSNQGTLNESFKNLAGLSLVSTSLICLYAGHQMMKGIFRHDTKNTIRRAKSIKQALTSEFSRA